jgi:hypothetical protein
VNPWLIQTLFLLFEHAGKPLSAITSLRVASAVFCAGRSADGLLRRLALHSFWARRPQSCGNGWNPSPVSRIDHCFCLARLQPQASWYGRSSRFGAAWGLGALAAAIFSPSTIRLWVTLGLICGRTGARTNSASQDAYGFLRIAPYSPSVDDDVLRYFAGSRGGPKLMPAVSRRKPGRALSPSRSHDPCLPVARFSDRSTICDPWDCIRAGPAQFGDLLFDPG